MNIQETVKSILPNGTVNVYKRSNGTIVEVVNEGKAQTCIVDGRGLTENDLIVAAERLAQRLRVSLLKGHFPKTRVYKFTELKPPTIKYDRPPKNKYGDPVDIPPGHESDFVL